MLVAPDDAVRPHIPAWLACHLPVVPASLCRTTDGTVEALTATLPTLGSPRRPDAPAWFRDTAVRDHDGFVYLTTSPKSARDCLELLEHGTTVRDMLPPERGAAIDGTVEHGVSESDALRVISFPSVEQARQRALLLFLLTYDPFLGARALPPSMVSSALFSVAHSVAEPRWPRAEQGAELVPTSLLNRRPLGQTTASGRRALAPGERTADTAHQSADCPETETDEQRQARMYSQQVHLHGDNEPSARRVRASGQTRRVDELQVALWWRDKAGACAGPEPRCCCTGTLSARRLAAATVPQQHRRALHQC